MSWFNHQQSKGLNMRVAHFSIRFCVFVFFTQGGDAKQTGKSSTDSPRKTAGTLASLFVWHWLNFAKLTPFQDKNQYTNPAVPCEFPWEKKSLCFLEFLKHVPFLCFVKKTCPDLDSTVKRSEVNSVPCWSPVANTARRFTPASRSIWSSFVAALASRRPSRPWKAVLVRKFGKGIFWGVFFWGVLFCEEALQ